MGLLEQAQAAPAGAPEQGGAMAPQLAQAAAAAGAPPPGAQAAPGGAPPPGGAPTPGPGGPGGAPTPAPGGPGGAPTPAPGGPGGAPTPAPGGMGAQNDPSAAMQKYQKEASPEVQQEYERAMRAVTKVLYSNDATANSIVDQVDPSDPISTIPKVTSLFIKELDRKINMHEEVVAEVTRESVDRIAELAEARHGIEISPTDMEKILGSSWEFVNMMFGSDPQNFTQTVQSMDPDTLSSLKQQHESILSQRRF